MVVNVFPFCRVSSLKGSLDDDLPWLGPWEGEETDVGKTPVSADSSLRLPSFAHLDPFLETYASEDRPHAVESDLCKRMTV